MKPSTNKKADSGSFLSRIVFFLLFLLLFTSCSIEKRLYRPGVHVEWSHESRVGSHESRVGSHESGVGSHESRVTSHKSEKPFTEEKIKEEFPVTEKKNEKVIRELKKEEQKTEEINKPGERKLFKANGKQNKEIRNVQQGEMDWETVAIVSAIIGLVCLIIGIIMAASVSPITMGATILLSAAGAGLGFACLIWFILDPASFMEACVEGCGQLFIEILIGLICG